MHAATWRLMAGAGNAHARVPTCCQPVEEPAAYAPTAPLFASPSPTGSDGTSWGSHLVGSSFDDDNTASAHDDQASHHHHGHHHTRRADKSSAASRTAGGRRAQLLGVSAHLPQDLARGAWTLDDFVLQGKIGAGATSVVHKVRSGAHAHTALA
jgi:hypothetical protein